MRVKQMNKYLIVGDTEYYDDCLVAICNTDRVYAEQVLQQMETNPDNDISRGYTNLRIEEIPVENCWLN